MPSDARKIEISGATVPFFLYKEGEDTVYLFDTSDTEPPVPMINAMAGLKLIDSPDVKLVMINHKPPMGLFDKIGENYKITKQNLSDGNVKVIFEYLEGESQKADLSKNSCEG